MASTIDSGSDSASATSSITQFDRSKLKSVSHLTVVKTAASFFVVDTSPDARLHMVVPGVFIGSQDAASNHNGCVANGITHVLNCATASAIPPARPNELKYKSLELLDVPQTDIRPAIQPAIEFIRSALANRPPPATATATATATAAAPASSDNKSASAAAPVSTSGGVLIHCNAGVSRSSAITIAYLMTDYALSYADAHAHVKRVRTAIQPNAGFVEQLKRYETELSANPIPADSNRTAVRAAALEFAISQIPPPPPAAGSKGPPPDAAAKAGTVKGLMSAFTTKK